MPNFKYKAINPSGATISGVVTADTAELAENVLTSQGYIPMEIADESASEKDSLIARLNRSLAFVKARDLIIFTKQFRTMFNAGLPILQIMQILEHQTENLKLRNAIAEIGIEVKEGSTLHGAFAAHPSIFSPLYVSMVRAGEASGNLVEVLNRLIYILEHEHKVKSDVRSALNYPIIVVIALFGAFIFLLTFVIPQFAKIYSKAGVALPLPTRISLAMYHALSNYWHLMILIIAFTVLGFYLYFRKTGQGIYVLHSLLLRIPILGPLFVKVAMSRFASIFAILQSSGIPVLTSLQILRDTIGNEAISREFERVQNQVEEGRGISTPLRAAKYFPPMVIDMISVGEESGQLDEMLHQVSVHYDDEVEYAVRRLNDALGPILIAGLAFVVGFFALAIFLPMWDLARVQMKF